MRAQRARWPGLVLGRRLAVLAADHVQVVTAVQAAPATCTAPGLNVGGSAAHSVAAHLPRSALLGAIGPAAGAHRNTSPALAAEAGGELVGGPAALTGAVAPGGSGAAGGGDTVQLIYRSLQLPSYDKLAFWGRRTVEAVAESHSLDIPVGDVKGEEA